MIAARSRGDAPTFPTILTIAHDKRGHNLTSYPYVQKDIAYKDVTEAARETMRRIVDQLESVENPPELIQEKLLELALELHTVSGKKKYGYLKKPLKDKVDSIVDELENLPEVAAYYSVWNDLRDTLEGYYKSKPRQHNPLSQQKEFRAIKNAIIQEAERLRCQLEESSEQTSVPPTLTDEHISSITSQFARLPSEYLLNSTIRLFNQMRQIFRDNVVPPSNPMGILIDSKRRKKLMQKRAAMGHKQDDHEQAQGYEQSLQILNALARNTNGIKSLHNFDCARTVRDTDGGFKAQKLRRSKQRIVVFTETQVSEKYPKI